MHATRLLTLGLSWTLGCAAAADGTSTLVQPGDTAEPPDAAGAGAVDASSPPSPIETPTLVGYDAASQRADDAGPAPGDAGPRTGGAAGSPEVCDNGWDDDQDGLVDERCACNPGTMQACRFGPNGSAGNVCPQGTQSCSAGAEFSFWGPCVSTGAPFPKDVCECALELCDNATDDNCNGQVDEGCAVEVPVNIDGDCVTERCPAWAPYPVGCDLMMQGGDSRGCVANAAGSSEVYFQEGDACPILGGLLGSLGGDVGHISGKLLCSSQKGAALDATHCKLNKQDKIFPADRSGCP